MKLWLIFIQGDDSTWLEAAWDDQSISESPDKWEETVEDARFTAQQNGGQLRVVSTEVKGVYDLFETPELKASPAQPTGGETNG